MCTLHITGTDGIAKHLETVVVNCVLEPGQITNELTKPVIGLNCILRRKVPWLDIRSGLPRSTRTKESERLTRLGRETMTSL